MACVVRPEDGASLHWSQCDRQRCVSAIERGFFAAEQRWPGITRAGALYVHETGGLGISFRFPGGTGVASWRPGHPKIRLANDAADTDAWHAFRARVGADELEAMPHPPAQDLGTEVRHLMARLDARFGAGLEVSVRYKHAYRLWSASLIVAGSGATARQWLASVEAATPEGLAAKLADIDVSAFAPRPADASADAHKDTP